MTERTLDRGLSAYFDVARALAAMTVFVVHCNDLRFSGNCLKLPRNLGSAAVVIFFVLSGYLITYVARAREHTGTEFAASRFARIYSVAIPALILTIVVDQSLIAVNLTEGIPLYQYGKPWVYLPMFLTFSTDFWFFGENAFSNAPFWSLSYEVWYYIAFGIFVYARRWRRLAAIAGVVALVGPKIWLEAPIWLAGSVLYELHQRVSLRRTAARMLFWSSLAVICAMRTTDIDLQLSDTITEIIGGWPEAHLRYSSAFLGDWLFAFIVAANMFSVKYCGYMMRWISPTAAFLAGISFSLYLTHYPFLLLCTRQFGMTAAPLFVAVLGSSIIFGLLFERQKHRWRRLALSIAVRFATKLERSAAPPAAPPAPTPSLRS